IGRQVNFIGQKTCKIRTLSLRMAFTTGGRFPRARPQPRANRTLVMKALRHDVAFLAFLPLSNSLVVGSSDSCCSRRSRRLTLQPFELDPLRRTPMEFIH